MLQERTLQKRLIQGLISENLQKLIPNGLESPAWNDPLWRYMDLAKLVAMLAKGTLPLIRVDMFDDSWEGFPVPVAATHYQGFNESMLKKQDLRLEAKAEQLRRCYYANCWHGSHGESNAMWNLYLSGKEGLAIKTTYERLVFSLRAAKGILIAKVRYDKRNAGQSMLEICMTKRKPFEDEKEIRVIWHDEEADTSHPGNEADKCKDWPCNVKELIEYICIAPRAGVWFEPALRELLKKYGLKDVAVKASSLSRGPRWGRQLK